MESKTKCPQCSRPASWQDNPDRPFCSERCRLIDLGRWADGSYRIAGKSQDALAEKNVVHLNHVKQDPERS